MVYILILFINIPNFLFCLYSDKNYSLYFIAPLFFCLSLARIVPKLTYFLCLIVFPFSVLESIFIFQYKRVSDEQIYAIIRETNFSESISWLGINGLLLLIGTFAVMIFFISKIKKIKKINLSLKLFFLIVISNFCIIFSILFTENDEYWAKFDKQFSKNENSVVGMNLIGANGRSFFFENFPWGLINRIGVYVNLEKGMISAKNEISKFKFGASQNEYRKNDSEIFVLIIGETGRPDRWSLNGYEKLTNPKLSDVKNLISFRNVITNWAWTRMSVPVIISRKPPSLVGSFFPEKSIVSAFKEAGFWTEWISTQGALGFHESAVALYASEADEVRYINPTTYLGSGAKDLELIPFFRDALSKPFQKKFIVLHTLGSHYNYRDRITSEFEKFSPNLSELKNPSLHEEGKKIELNNSYDNTIVYTDNFIYEVISELKKNNNLASVFYIADHGENLFDGNCDKSGHGHNTEVDYRVAAMWWSSDFFVKKYSKKIEYLKNMTERPWGTENIFESLLDMAEIGIENIPRKNKSIADPNFSLSSRKVQSGFDFDKAVRIGACNVIGPSK